MGVHHVDVMDSRQGGADGEGRAKIANNSGGAYFTEKGQVLVHLMSDEFFVQKGLSPVHSVPKFLGWKGPGGVPLKGQGHPGSERSVASKRDVVSIPGEPLGHSEQAA